MFSPVDVIKVDFFVVDVLELYVLGARLFNDMRNLEMFSRLYSECTQDLIK